MIPTLSKEMSGELHEFVPTSLPTSSEPAPHEPEPTRLGYRDFDHFGRWYSNRRYRKSGRAASPHTLRTKQVHLAACANMLGLKEEKFLGDSLGSREQVVFLMDRIDARMTPGAARQAVYALRSFAEYAEAMGWCYQAELKDTDIPPRNGEKPITVYSPAEMAAFVSSARGVDLHWWALIAFLAHTGRRVGESLGLRWEWLRADGSVPYFEMPGTKNGENQYVPLDRFLREEVFTPTNIANMKQRERFQGRRREGGKSNKEYVWPYTYNTVHGRFSRFCKRAGLPNRGFHNFRHTVITTRLAEGMPLQAVSALAGHSSSAITDRRYNHTNALSFAHLLDQD